MEKPLDSIVLELARIAGGWTTIDCRVQTNQTLYIAVGSTRPGRSTSVEEYRARSTGQRMYQLYYIDGAAKRRVLSGYNDGKRCADVRHLKAPDGEHQQSITIEKTFLSETKEGYLKQSEILRFYHVGLMPIAEAIAKAERHGLSRVSGRECVRFYFAGVPGPRDSQDLVYDLEATNSAIMRVAAYADRDRFIADDPDWAWEVKRLDEIQGYPVATESSYTSFRHADGNSDRRLTNDYQVESIRFDEPILDSAFWPKYEPGVFINDLIAGKSYYNTPDGKAPANKAVAEVKAPVGPPLVARPAADWSGWASGGGIVLGVALLAAGIALKLRR